jgi:DNA-3-methyladenine glycosylase II
MKTTKRTHKKSDSNGSLADKKTWRTAAKHLAEVDPVLAKVIQAYGPYEFELEDGYYEALVGAIIFQQLAGKAAQAILNRFKALYEGKIPTPKEFLKTPETKLRSSGLSPQKISYLKDLCTRLETGTLDLKHLQDLADDEVIRELDEVRGVGRWTAEMFLMFSLGRTNVLPVDDLGLQKAAQKLYGLDELPSHDRFEELAKAWHPYRSIASIYLWRSTEPPNSPTKW